MTAPRIAAVMMVGLVAITGLSRAAGQGGVAEGRGVVSGATAHDLTAPDVEAWLHGLMSYGLKNGEIAGAVVAVVKDGKTLFQSGYGYADVAAQSPMDAGTTLTRIGSTSKLFTWTAVMQLVEQGKLDLDRNVDDYLDFKVSPPRGKPITLLDLMNHRGGFEEGLKEILSMDPHPVPSTEAYLKQHPRPLLFAPGSVPAYSNYGAALAGYVVERVSGEPFERYVEHHIFQPLGMLHSTFDQPLPERFMGSLSRGYRQSSQAAQPIEQITTRPAGSVAATAADMTRFMLAHLQQGGLDGFQMLRPDTEVLMQSPSETVPPGFASMAHGVFHETRNGRTVVGHGGDTVFFHSEFVLLPQEGVGLFYSFNSRGKDGATYGLRKAVLDQFMDRYFPDVSVPNEPKPIASAPAAAARIAGRYESSRRIEHGFLSVFYLLQQSVIRANPDGSIDAPAAFEPGESHFRETAPDMWREIGGSRMLALQDVNGVKTVIDSEDPTSVLQSVPARRSASLNLTMLLLSILVLLATVVLWPISALVRRHYRAPTVELQVRRPRMLLRIAAVLALVWLAGWIFVLTPMLSVQLNFYGAELDPVIRTLQLGGVIVIGLALVGVGSAWRLFARVSWPTRLGYAAIAASLLGMVWIGCMGDLIGFNLNY